MAGRDVSALQEAHVALQVAAGDCCWGQVERVDVIRTEWQPGRKRVLTWHSEQTRRELLLVEYRHAELQAGRQAGIVWGASVKAGNKRLGKWAGMQAGGQARLLLGIFPCNCIFVRPLSLPPKWIYGPACVHCAYVRPVYDMCDVWFWLMGCSRPLCTLKTCAFGISSVTREPLCWIDVR